jgi:hypothetical protein
MCPFLGGSLGLWCCSEFVGGLVDVIVGVVNRYIFSVYSLLYMLMRGIKRVMSVVMGCTCDRDGP